MRSENLLNGNGQNWKNSSVLFCHSSVDDAKIPYRPFRLLLHLQRRIGKRTERSAKINPGIKSIAETCKMQKDSVERGLRWLKARGYIELGKTGRRNHYRVLVPRRKLYIDPRLDDYGLSAVQVRVLAHMARLSTSEGEFFINEGTFAKVCGMDRKTIKSALASLEGVFYYADDTRSNPRYFLIICEDVFPRAAAL
jgi:hypothetical protein